MVSRAAMPPGATGTTRSRKGVVVLHVGVSSMMNLPRNTAQDPSMLVLPVMLILGEPNPRSLADLRLLGHPPDAISVLTFSKLHNHLARLVFFHPPEAMYSVHILVHVLGPFWGDFPKQTYHILPDLNEEPLAMNQESPSEELVPLKKRRTRISDKPNSSLNLWSIMKNCIGKERPKSQCLQLKRPWLNPCFRYLLLFCLVLLVFCSSNSLSWWDSFQLKDHYQRFINPVHRPPLYRDRLKDRVQLNETTEQTTLPPTVPPKALQFHRAYPRNYHFVMDNKEVCKTKTPFLVLMVPVAPKNVAARDAIRQTWGNSSEVQGDVVLTLFMMASIEEPMWMRCRRSSNRRTDCTTT
ncbi:hypothetical protein F7725_006280 [Dissostichus mawsoni]|uniref:Hexosyltransferase n=1 Tax=Dissostichus mawsoni TaxID=36200 RepID=A0A7J5YTW8_DISMA|nr:hypothetical protein F7725_006280 [Dissostichus mawsoni]